MKNTYKSNNKSNITIVKARGMVLIFILFFILRTKNKKTKKKLIFSPECFTGNITCILNTTLSCQYVNIQ